MQLATLWIIPEGARILLCWNEGINFESPVAVVWILGRLRSVLYFAYGSNMSPRQMRTRCPGSRAAGVAELAGWRFIITKRGTANIVKAAGGRVYGTLWHCLPSHLEMLDRYEAVRLRVYRRRTVVVQLADGRTRHAIVYVSSLHQRGRARREYLKTAVLPGAHAFRLPPDYIDEIARWLPPGRIGAAKPRYRGRRH